MPYRRTRAWPSGFLGRVRTQAKVYCIQIHYGTGARCEL